MILLLCSALAYAQATCVLHVSGTLVDINEIVWSQLPAEINGSPVYAWTALGNGPQAELTVSPCDGCSYVLWSEAVKRDWEDYPYPPRVEPASDSVAEVTSEG